MYSVTRISESCRDRRRSLLYQSFSYIRVLSVLYTLIQALIWDKRKSRLYPSFSYPRVMVNMP